MFSRFSLYRFCQKSTRYVLKVLVPGVKTVIFIDVFTLYMSMKITVCPFVQYLYARRTKSYHQHLCCTVIQVNKNSQYVECSKKIYTSVLNIGQCQFQFPFFPWFFYTNNAFQSYMPLDNVACFLCFFVYDVTPFFNEMLWAIHMLTSCSPGYKNGTFILVWGPADCSMPYYMPTSLCYVRHSPKIIETPFVSWRQLKSCCHSIPMFGWQI